MEKCVTGALEGPPECFSASSSAKHAERSAQKQRRGTPDVGLTPQGVGGTGQHWGLPMEKPRVKTPAPPSSLPSPELGSRPTGDGHSSPFTGSMAIVGTSVASVPSGQLRVFAQGPDFPELMAPTGLNLGLPAALNSSLCDFWP